MTDISQIRRGDTVRVTLEGQVVRPPAKALISERYHLALCVVDDEADVLLTWEEGVLPAFELTSSQYLPGDVAEFKDDRNNTVRAMCIEGPVTDQEGFETLWVTGSGSTLGQSYVTGRPGFTLVSRTPVTP